MLVIPYFPGVRRSRALAFPLALLLLTLPACEGGGGGVTQPKPDETTASVSVTTPATGVQARQSVQLSATARNAAGTALSGKSFTWRSSSDAVASVSATGLVTGIAPGTVTLTATETASNQSGSVSLSITPPAVASVEISPAAVTVPSGATHQLTATLKDAEGGVLTARPVAWSSSSPAVATVDAATGLVRAVAESGTATITATAEGKTATATITATLKPVASLSLEPAAFTLTVNETRTLVVTARDAAGTPLAGRTVTLISSDAAVARLTGAQVTAMGEGMATITATAEGKTATATVTVTRAPISSLSISPATVTLVAGAVQQLAATARDAAGNELSGRGVAWSSSSLTVATVDASGRVTARAPGSATITAASEGKSATAAVTVPPAARVQVTPGFAAVDLNATVGFAASAFTAAGTNILVPGTTWRSLGTGTASVTASGVATGVAAGQARIVAQADAASDTAVVAVLGPQSLLSTAFVAGQAKAEVKAGQAITVPVVLDLSKVSPTGDLGAAQFELQYDPSVLVFQAATAGVTGGTDFNVPAPGTFRFSFAGTSAQGAPRLTLVTLTFQVAQGAAAGMQRALSLGYTTRPASTGFQRYEAPIAVGGRIRVVP
jgi:uncharacterized protein YjdB